MTNEELISLAKQGNIAATEQLYFNNLPLIKKMCNRFSNNINNSEDVLQEAYFCLLQAIEAFDIKSGFKFITYLTNMIVWQMPRLLKKSTLKEQLTLNSLTGNDEDTELIDLLEDSNCKNPDSCLIENEFKNITLRELEKLPDNLGKLILDHFGKRKTVKTLAAETKTDIRDVLNKLRIGKERIKRNYVLRKLYKEWIGEIYSKGLKSTGLQTFRYTFTSSVERVVENRVEAERKRVKNMNYY